MPEVIITYEKPETLKLLKSLAKQLGLNITTKVKPKEKDQIEYLNGVPVMPVDENASVEELKKIFEGKSIDAAQLRKQAWQRKK